MTSPQKVPECRSRASWSDIAKIVLVIVFGIAALWLEIYGIKAGYLRYMGPVLVLLVGTVGLSGFTNSYNKLRLASDGTKTAVKNRLKLSAEKAAAVGVVSLTCGVALGIYSLDGVNSEANFTKMLHAQEKMGPYAKLLGCKIDGSDVGDCKKFHDALNELWGAVQASNVSSMAADVQKVHNTWEILSIRWPRIDRDRFESAASGLDELKYWSDSIRQMIALFLTFCLLPFSVAATSRKLAVAAYDAGFCPDNVKVTWRMVIKRAALKIWSVVYPRAQTSR